MLERRDVLKENQHKSILSKIYGFLGCLGISFTVIFRALNTKHTYSSVLVISNINSISNTSVLEYVVTLQNCSLIHNSYHLKIYVLHLDMFVSLCVNYCKGQIQ